MYKADHGSSLGIEQAPEAFKYADFDHAKGRITQSLAGTFKIGPRVLVVKKLSRKVEHSCFFVQNTFSGDCVPKATTRDFELFFCKLLGFQGTVKIDISRKDGDGVKKARLMLYTSTCMGIVEPLCALIKILSGVVRPGSTTSMYWSTTSMDWLPILPVEGYALDLLPILPVEEDALDLLVRSFDSVCFHKL